MEPPSSVTVLALKTSVRGHLIYIGYSCFYKYFPFVTRLRSACQTHECPASQIIYILTYFHQHRFQLINSSEVRVSGIEDDSKSVRLTLVFPRAISSLA